MFVKIEDRARDASSKPPCGRSTRLVHSGAARSPAVRVGAQPDGDDPAHRSGTILLRDRADRECR